MGSYDRKHMELDTSLRLPLLPSYPTSSLDFIHERRTRDQGQVEHSIVILDVIIVGAGLGGLATACALARRGHRVTVFEQAHQLGEVGAGIQMPPNSTRLLLKWGLGEFLDGMTVEPTNVTFRRWQDGSGIGCTKLNPNHRKSFGAPYYVVHRAHFHEALYKLAVRLGAKVQIGARVQQYDPETPSITLTNGSAYSADLIVAADGIKSLARRTVTGLDVPPTETGFAAYRATVDVDKIRADPDISWIVDQPSINLWVGHNRHVMTYPIASGKSFNLVLSHPQDTSDKVQGSFEILDEMRQHFAGWDQQLTKIIALIHTTMKWPLMSLPSLPTYLHSSSKLIIMGDGAHAMLPYMSQAAAMAVEDGAALAQALHLVGQRGEVDDALKLWNEVRVQRSTQMQEASSINGTLWHFADGWEQQARDDAMRWELAEETDEFSPFSSPNQWSDRLTSAWCFGYDAEEEIARRDILLRLGKKQLGC